MLGRNRNMSFTRLLIMNNAAGIRVICLTAIADDFALERGVELCECLS